MKLKFFPLFLGIFFATTLQAKLNTQSPQKIVCSNQHNIVHLNFIGDALVSFKVISALDYQDMNPFGYLSNDGSSNYSILVDDSYDTNTWFDLSIKNGIIIKRELIISGNDSDNHAGFVRADGDNAFICN